MTGEGVREKTGDAFDQTKNDRLEQVKGGVATCLDLSRLLRSLSPACYRWSEHYQIDPDDNQRPGGCQLSGLERRRFQHWGSGEITGEALKSGAVLRLRKGMSEPGQFMSPSSGIVLQ